MKDTQTLLLSNLPKSKLAEGPVWDHRTNTLWWVDILGGDVHSYRPEQSKVNTYSIGQYVGAIVPNQDHGLIVAGHQAFYEYIDEQLAPTGNFNLDAPNIRFNDGKCDAMGRFWAGTMELDASKPIGKLFCLDSGQVSQKLDGVYCSNGMAWSLDQTQMYYIDSMTHKLRVFDFDLSTGHIAYGRDLIIFEPSMGYPDGMTIDANGNLWVCFYDGGMVRCFDPHQATEIASLKLPVQRPTSCTFGGSGLDQLYITTAKEDGNVLGGSIFVARPGVVGLPTHFYQQ